MFYNDIPNNLNDCIIIIKDGYLKVIYNGKEVRLRREYDGIKYIYRVIVNPDVLLPIEIVAMSEHLGKEHQYDNIITSKEERAYNVLKHLSRKKRVRTDELAFNYKTRSLLVSSYNEAYHNNDLALKDELSDQIQAIDRMNRKIIRDNNLFEAYQETNKSDREMIRKSVYYLKSKCDFFKQFTVKTSLRGVIIKFYKEESSIYD